MFATYVSKSLNEIVHRHMDQILHYIVHRPGHLNLITNKMIFVYYIQNKTDSLWVFFTCIQVWTKKEDV